MYSLYRAWLLRESSPPDVVVCVGSGTGRASHQFSGHRTVLSSQSGYLKSLLSEPRVSDTAQAQILVPNVSPEVFAPLLTFMYTGFLDLTPENIYGVLLATHLLHMPRALDLCRSYLLQQQQVTQIPPTPQIIKPIPSRKMLPVLLPPPTTATHGIYWPPPPPYHPLPPLSDDTAVYRSVFPLALSKPETQVSNEHPPASPLVLPSTSDGRPGSASSSQRRCSVSPTPSQTSDSSDRVTVTVTRRSKSKKQHHTPTVESKVDAIVDVACCDGPVRFHRVLNRNYGLLVRKEGTRKKSRSNSLVDNENGSVPTEYKSDEGDTDSASATGSTVTREPGPVFTCRFCNHTFKSHYCYQKHARRHINPVDPEIASTASSSTDETIQNRTPQPTVTRQKELPPTATQVSPPQPPPPPQEPPKDSGPGQKREVRLLDMNVQYYPCKTCGSKFPSYYFVHKHRKICHPGDESTTPTNSQENSSTE